MRTNGIEPDKTLRKKLVEKLQVRNPVGVGTFDKPKKIPAFLEWHRDSFCQELTKLEINKRLVDRILDQGIPAPDINLVFEILSHQQQTLANPEKLQFQLPSIEVDIFKENLAVSTVVKNLKNNPKIKAKKFRSPFDNSSEFGKLNPHSEVDNIAHWILNNKSPRKPTVKLTSETDTGLGNTTRRGELFTARDNLFSSREGVMFDPAAPSEAEIGDDPEEQLNQLTRRQRSTVQDHYCLNCKIREANTVLMPCGHVAVCIKCVVATQMNVCLICQSMIRKYTVMKQKER